MALHTGWSDHAWLSAFQVMDYSRLVSVVLGMVHYLGDPTWDAWHGRVTKARLVRPSSYLRVYLCPDASITGVDAQAIAALLAPWPMDLNEIFPEMRWSGVHRHLHLSHWYTGTLGK
jgi:hypothetical protein